MKKVDWWWKSIDDESQLMMNADWWWKLNDDESGWWGKVIDSESWFMMKFDYKNSKVDWWTIVTNVWTVSLESLSQLKFFLIFSP